MKTVLLWGSAWWLADAAGPVVFENLQHAAEALAARLGGDRPRLRMVYQPDSLESAATECPNTGRPGLAAALAEEFPALGERGCAWSHEPILPRGEAFTTLVHFQREPEALTALVIALENHGFAIDSAWPLGTFLAALPTEWTESGSQTILALRRDQACVYRHGNEGRVILHWRGASVLTEVRAWIAGLLGANANESLLIVVGDDDPSLVDEIAEFEHAQFLSLREALEKAVVLPRKHPAQLLPPVPVVTAQRAVISGGLLLLILGGVWGASYARDCLAWRTEGETREAQRRSLRAEVAHLQANVAEIAELRGRLAGFSAGAPGAAFMEKISTALPREIVLGSVRIEARTFTVRGHVSPAAPATAVETWRAKSADPRWTLNSAAVAADGAFTLPGEFKS